MRFPKHKSFTRLIGDGDEAIEKVVAAMGWTVNINKGEQKE